MLKINYFNGFEVWVEKRPLTHFYSQKTRALLAYLAVEAGRSHQRSHLAGLLWPNYSEARARRNLSQTLTMLRKDLEAAATLLQSSTHTVGLSKGDKLVVDVLSFEHSLTAVSRHSHINVDHCTTCTETLQKAAALYSGDFLDQFVVSDTSQFENWLLNKREQLLQQAIDLFTRLSQSYAIQGQLDNALAVTQRLLMLVPWLESAHRQRMLLLAQQGLRTQALAQYDLLCSVLMAELGVAPASETDALYDQILAGEVGGGVEGGGQTAVSVSSQFVPPFQVPSLPPYFVGRDAPFQQIQQILKESGNQPVCIAIVGMGGIGKTTFAAYIAHKLKSQFVDGVLWGSSKTSSTFNILETWARAYDFDFSRITDLDSKSMAVRDILSNKQVLVMLDNVESATDAYPLLLHGKDTVTIITTRNREVAVALNAKPIPLIELAPTMSLQLFYHILGEARVNATPVERDAAVTIGEQLHHLPLAVEIAAKRLLSRPRMRLVALAQRLESKQQRLGLTISDQAVRTSFQVSWDGLPPSDQQIFAAMGHFAGRSFLPEAVAAIVNQDLVKTEDSLFSLAALSLVSEVGEVRYQQHPLLADFAAEKLIEAKDVQVEQQQRLVAYYLALVQRVGEDYVQLALEWEQITAVIQLIYQQQQWQQLLTFTDILTPAWSACGYYSQARQGYQMALEAAQKLDNFKQKALILRRWGEACLEQNDYEMAQDYLTQSLTHYYQLEEEDGIARAQYMLARIAIEQGHYDKATDLLNNSQAILDETNNRRELGDVFYHQAWIAYANGFRLDDADAFLAQALPLYEQADEQIGRIEVLRMKADVARKRGNHVQAETLALAAKALSEQLQEQSQLASTLFALATIYLDQGELEKAKVYVEDSLIILRRTGIKRIEGMALRHLSAIYRQQGDYQTALTLMKQSLDIFQKLDLALSQAFSYYGLAVLYQLLNEHEAGEKAKRAAYQLAKQLAHQPLMNRIQQEL